MDRPLPCLQYSAPIAPYPALAVLSNLARPMSWQASVQAAHTSPPAALLHTCSGATNMCHNIHIRAKSRGKLQCLDESGAWFGKLKDDSDSIWVIARSRYMCSAPASIVTPRKSPVNLQAKSTHPLFQVCPEPVLVYSRFNTKVRLDTGRRTSPRIRAALRCRRLSPLQSP